MYRDHQLSSRNNLGQQSALEAFGLLHTVQRALQRAGLSVGQSVSQWGFRGTSLPCVPVYVILSSGNFWSVPAPLHHPDYWAITSKAVRISIRG